jgi:flagellar hook-length control protein FliK
MAAVREALAQSVDWKGPVPTPPAASTPEVDPAPQALRVAPDRIAAPVAMNAAVQPPLGEAPVVVAAPQEHLQASQPADPALAAAGTPTVDATSIGTPRPARQASAQAPMAVSNAPVGPDAAIDDTVEALPGRKATHDDAPAPAARPTARAAQAIAAFHAAAAIGAATTPAAANAAVMSAAVSSTPLLDTELPTQLIQAIRVQFDQGSGEARIRLNPGFLGGVTVGVQIDGSSVTASLQAGSADVREWMRTNESMLRQALADQGLRLDRLVIVDEDVPASSDEHDARPNDKREQQAPRRQRRPAEQGTFELVF